MSVASVAGAREAPEAARPRTTEPVIEVEALSKRFPIRRSWRELLRHPRSRARQLTALDGVSFTAGRGEFFGLLGPNGAGKTTLFKILSTLVLPDGGRARVAGWEVAREPTHVRAAIASVIPEERSLLWRLSARDNLVTYAALHRLHGRAMRERVEELLELVGLESTGGRMVGQFSSGMRQRLLVARALLARPRVLLLDEPTRSLDPLSARQLRRFFREEIAGRLGCTVLLATHTPEEALELCDRVAVLDRGRLLAVGPPGDLAREIVGQRYRALVHPEGQDAAVLLERTGARVLGMRPAEEEGWVEVELEVERAAGRAATVVRDLCLGGVQVAHFEPVQLPLAELLERIIGRREEATSCVE